MADKTFVSWFLCGKSFAVESVTKLTNQLVASYAKAGGINHLDGKNLPSKRAIAAITCDLLRLLFPGFFDEKLIHSSEIKAETATLLDAVLGTLEDEIRKSLEYNPPGGLAKKNITSEAHKLTVEFLESLPRVREILQTDVEAAFDGDPAAASKEEIIVSYLFIEAIAVQRLAHELYLKKVALIPRIMAEWAHTRTGMDLHPGARIGSHFFVDHGTGTVVGETAIIGNHVKMYHGVTLGAKSTAGGQQLRGRKRHPTIENNVTIYPGATILGGETIIGAGSTIGGNVFIMNSVAPNSLVIYDGLDMRVMSKTDKNAILDFQI
jgi:serine O-acetyltransferase